MVTKLVKWVQKRRQLPLPPAARYVHNLWQHIRSVSMSSTRTMKYLFWPWAACPQLKMIKGVNLPFGNSSKHQITSQKQRVIMIERVDWAQQLFQCCWCHGVSAGSRTEELGARERPKFNFQWNYSCSCQKWHPMAHLESKTRKVKFFAGAGEPWVTWSSGSMDLLDPLEQVGGARLP